MMGSPGNIGEYTPDPKRVRYVHDEHTEKPEISQKKYWDILLTFKGGRVYENQSQLKRYIR
ncbi:MAG: hypothetical protein N3F66_12725 [Spirochaetes bacterium]|nr:hypothetical protein [Spirochaetota bacterium]